MYELNDADKREYQQKLEQLCERLKNERQKDIDQDYRKLVEQELNQRGEDGLSVSDGAGLDDSKGYMGGFMEQYRDAKVLAAQNPYLVDSVRERVDALCAYYGGELLEERARLVEELDMYEKAKDEINKELEGLSDNSREYAGHTYMRGLLTNKTLDGEARQLDLLLTSEAVKDAVECLNTGVVPKEEMALQVLDKVGLDPVNSPSHKKLMELQAEPDQVQVQCEKYGFIDRDAFADKMLKTPAPLTAHEKDYGVSTFDRSLNGLYGNGKQDVTPDHPMYLGKFDYIFVDGKSVSSLCAKQTGSMSDAEKSAYMKCFTTAQVLARDKRMECALPEVTFSRDEDGALLKNYAKPDPNKPPKIIPLVPTVNPKEPGFWHKAKTWLNKALGYEFFNVGSKASERGDKDYLNLLESDTHKKERQGNMSQSLTARNIRQNMIDEDKAFVAGRDPAQFFRPDDIKAVFGKARWDEAMNRERVMENNIFKNNPPDPDRHPGTMNPIDNGLAFKPENCAGMTYLNKAGRRNEIAMLYMYANGYSIEDIHSTAPEMVEAKAQMSKDLYGILHEGDTAKIAQTFAEMTKALLEYKIPEDADFTKPADVAKYGSELKFIKQMTLGLTGTMEIKPPYKEPFDKAYGSIMGEEGMKALHGLTHTTSVIGLNLTLEDYCKNSRTYADPAAAASIADLPERDRATETALMVTGIMSKEAGRALNEMRGKTLFQIDATDAVMIRQNNIMQETGKLSNAIVARNGYGEINDYLSGNSEQRLFESYLKGKGALVLPGDVKIAHDSPTLTLNPLREPFDSKNLFEDTFGKAKTYDSSQEKDSGAKGLDAKEKEEPALGG